MKEQNVFFVTLPGMDIKLYCQGSLKKHDVEELKKMLKNSRSSPSTKIGIEEESTPNTAHYQISVKKVRKNPITFDLTINSKAARITKKSVRDSKVPTVFHMFKNLCGN